MSQPETLDAPLHVRMMLAARTQRDWSQRELAAYLGVSVRTVKRWESGACDPPAMLLASLRECLRTD